MTICGAGNAAVILAKSEDFLKFQRSKSSFFMDVSGLLKAFCSPNLIFFTGFGKYTNMYYFVESKVLKMPQVWHFAICAPRNLKFPSNLISFRCQLTPFTSYSQPSSSHQPFENFLQHLINVSGLLVNSV